MLHSILSYNMTIAYLRISTEKQNLANQKEEIRRFAENRNLIIHQWVTEVVSGKKNEKERKLGALLKKLRQGDILIVTELSRLSRTLTEIMTIMGQCLEKKITLYSTKDSYAFDDSINSKVLCFAFGLVAEIERNLISMRTKEALALKRAEGVVLGRRKGYTPKLNILIENRHQIVRMLQQGASITRICEEHNVSRDTFNEFRKRYRSVVLAFEHKERRRLNRPRTRTPQGDPNSSDS